MAAGVSPGTRPGQRPELGFHLAGCAACRAFREQLVTVAAPPTAKAARVAVMAAPPELVPQPEVRVAPRSRVVWLLPVVVLLIVLALGWYWGVPLVRAWSNLQMMSADGQGGGVTLPARTTRVRPTPQGLVAARLRATPSATVTRVVATTTATSTSAAMTRTTLTTPTASPSATPTAIASPTATVTPTIQPSPTIAVPAGMTVLLMGIDARPNEGMLARTDSMILVRLDPQQHVVALMSLPRDLWVSIPGGGEGKINAAFYLGEAARAGGGPALARQTVSTLLGIPITNHVVVDFRGFRGLIDIIGGITVDVPSELYDPQFPTEDYGYMTAHFMRGPQHMNGDQALIYSRVRHPDSDFQRMRRQQQVLVAVGEALRQQGALTTLHHADELTAALAGYVHTDLAPEAAASMLWSLRDTNPQQIQHIAVDTAYLTQTNIGGAYALVGSSDLFHHLGAAFLQGRQP